MIDDEIQDYLFPKIVKYCWLELAETDRDWQGLGIVVVNMTTTTTISSISISPAIHPHWVFLFLLSFVLFDYLALE